MKSFESPIITHDENSQEPIISLGWGYNVVSGIQRRAIARGTSDLNNAGGPMKL